MPTTHTWNGASGVLFTDPSNYTDGTPFAPGDTLVVSSGSPGYVSTTSNVISLPTGTYEFTISGASAGLTTSNVAMDAASTLAVSGPGTLEWLLDQQFINAGTIQVGSSTASGAATLDMGSNTPTLTNQGSVTVQNGSQLRLQPNTISGTFVNAAEATVSVIGGSAFTLSSYNGYSNTGIGDENTTNNGLIEITGTAGSTTSADFQGSYQGSGVLSVRGAPGASASRTGVQIAGPASGTFDIASGALEFDTTPVGGFVNFRDNDAALILDRGAGTSYSAPGYPFGATIYGFQAGDAIDLNGTVPASSFTYDPSSHLLTIEGSGGSSLGQFTFAGSYQQSDFQVTPVGTGGVGGVDITTTSTANAIPGFGYDDTATGAAGTSPGQEYTGAVDYLQSQYIWAGQDSANVTAHLPDVFLKGGPGNDALRADSGSNVLDGGFGSNFLVGATGADGGTDTFFLDGRGSATTWDTLVKFHPGDAVTLWGYVPGQSVMSWAASEGAPGYQGATIHASLAGAGTPVNGSVTFAGVSLAAAQADFAMSSGTAGGLPYLYVKDTG